VVLQELYCGLEKSLPWKVLAADSYEHENETYTVKAGNRTDAHSTKQIEQRKKYIPDPQHVHVRKSFQRDILKRFKCFKRVLHLKVQLQQREKGSTVSSTNSTPDNS
jgi:hypothetical protein